MFKVTLANMRNLDFKCIRVDENNRTTNPDALVDFNVGFCSKLGGN